MGGGEAEMKPASEMNEGEGEKKRAGCCSGGEIDEAKEANVIVNRERGCCSFWPFSDSLVFIALAGFFIGMLYVFGKGCADGNLNRIQYGTDWNGNACGDSTYGTEDYKHQYWANPLYYDSLGSICLDSCPGVPPPAPPPPAYTSGYTSSSATTPQASATSSTTDLNHIYCVCNNQLTIGRTDNSEVPNSLANHSTSFLGKACASNCGPGDSCAKKGKNWVRFDNPSAAITTNPITGGVNNGLYYYLPQLWMAAYPAGVNLQLKWMVPQCMYAYETYQVMNRCIPKLSGYADFCDPTSSVSTSSGTASHCPDSGGYSDYMNSWAETGGQVLADINTTKWVLFASFFIAIALGFFFVWFMEKCACCVVWTVILLAVIMTAVLAMALFYFGMTLGEQLNEEPQIATYDAVQRNMYVCYVFGGIFAALFLAIFCTALLHEYDLYGNHIGVTRIGGFPRLSVPHFLPCGPNIRTSLLGCPLEYRCSPAGILWRAIYRGSLRHQ
jgi:hypothetical protein